MAICRSFTVMGEKPELVRVRWSIWLPWITHGRSSCSTALISSWRWVIVSMVVKGSIKSHKVVQLPWKVASFRYFRCLNSFATLGHRSWCPPHVILKKRTHCLSERYDERCRLRKLYCLQPQDSTPIPCQVADLEA